MKENGPGKGYEEREENGNRKDGSRPIKSDREDPAAAKDEAYKAFTKDKRTRISSHGTEKVEYRPRRDPGDDKPRSYDNPGDRRSYNPNFTSDNKPRFEKKDYGQERPYNREGGDQRNYRPRQEGYGGRDYNDRPRQNNDERPSYRNNERSDRPSYGDKPRWNNEGHQGNRRPYEDKPSYRNNGDRPQYNQDRPYGERKQYGDRPPYNRDTAHDVRKQYGDRPLYDKKPYGDNFQGRGGGYGGSDSNYNRSRNTSGSGQGYGNSGYNKERKPYQQGGYNRGGYQGERPSYSGSDRRPQTDYKPRNDFNYPTYAAEPLGDSIRLNRYIAMSGICSRREADEFIKSGVVSVNGNVITELGAKISPNDEVMFNGNVLKNEKKVYIVMNKPKGYVTSVEDPHADKTVIDLLNNGCRERVYPVGRLDKNSLGVLLITNDGDMAKKLTHPSYLKKKIYQITLDRPLTKADMDSIAEGITLEDGEIHADAISYVGDSRSEVGIEIHSGRNRIVRRIFEHLGYRVVKLDRVYFAGLTKQKLKRGQWRFLTPREVQNLRSGRYE